MAQLKADSGVVATKLKEASTALDSATMADGDARLQRMAEHETWANERWAEHGKTMEEAGTKHKEAIEVLTAAIKEDTGAAAAQFNTGEGLLKQSFLGVDALIGKTCNIRVQC